MRSPNTSTALRHRDAINEAYDRGCDLVEAAVAIRRVAGAPDVAPVVPALLACIECALDELANAAAALREMPPMATSDGSEGVTLRIVATDGRMRRGLANVEAALIDSRDIAGAARALAARAVAAASPDRSPS